MKTHKSDINPGFLVRHRLNIAPCDQQKAADLISELENLAGMDQVILDLDKNLIQIAYDGSRHDIDEILEIVRSKGIRIRKNWWNRVKLGFARQTDQNVRDNAGYHPPCCNKPPK